ncbi:alpha-1,2-mannosidase [Streptomyces abyssomicinicus]|uniref:alpha-1,2-mannosidase n=1 Tax=Streptomyces abyssomicinicus TaxID=574929 RepID=UPI0012505FD3|nr:alpha-1,2-mannosidase [Streptomyces abyssomicinicus]
MSFEATYADFSADPARLSNVGVTLHRARPAGSHLVVDAGGSVTLEFEVADPEGVPQVTLTVTALVSKSGRSPGYAPVDVLFQGEALAENLTVPGGGDLPQDNVFAVPGRLLKRGTNTLEIRSSPEARTMLWLHRITLDPVFERGRSERARTAEAARDSVFAFRTERRPAHAAASAPWQSAPRLLFHVDRGERSLPAQLGWRGTDGAEAAISFQSNMSDFHGCYRTADGAAYEYRGRLTGRWPFTAETENLSTAALHRFRTEEGWGGGWHASEELRLLVEDGAVPVERVTWRDQRGNSGVAVLHGVSAEAEVAGVEASDELREAHEVAGNLLEDSRAKWLAPDDVAHLDLTLARPAAVASYSLTTANDHPDRDPRDWTLHGSHDGRTWTPLDTRTGETFDARFQTREFTLRAGAGGGFGAGAGAETGGYRHYRLDITRNGGAGEVQLARVRLAAPADGQAFTGYYQRFDEGPIGYRGTPAPASPGSSARRLAVDLETAARGLAETARSLTALASQLRHGRG